MSATNNNNNAAQQLPEGCYDNETFGILSAYSSISSSTDNAKKRKVECISVLDRLIPPLLILKKHLGKFADEEAEKGEAGERHCTDKIGDGKYQRVDNVNIDNGEEDTAKDDEKTSSIDEDVENATAGESVAENKGGEAIDDDSNKKKNVTNSQRNDDNSGKGNDKTTRTQTPIETLQAYRDSLKQELKQQELENQKILRRRENFFQSFVSLHELYETGLDGIARMNDLRYVPDNVLPKKIPRG